MKKTGSIKFFENIDLQIQFDFEELMNFTFGDKLLVKGATEESVIKEKFVDKRTGSLKMDLIDEVVKLYVNQKIKEKYGNDFSLDVMDDTINISWDIKVESIKQKHIETWWDKE